MMRLDRHGYAVAVWFGLLCTGVKTLVVEHTAAQDVYLHDAGLPEWVEYFFATCFTFAALVLILGSAAGSRWFLPAARVGDVYRAELAALAVVVVVIGIDAVFKDRSLLQLFTLGGGFGAIVQLGSVRMMADLVHALRKDPRCQQ